MQQIHKYKYPIDLVSTQAFASLTNHEFGSYGVNLYKDGKFVEGRIYEMYSNSMMMHATSSLKRDGYEVKW
tara:strand:- start:1461 stop:1673 length:213 start_codon:yes stop_codon:yes gene_type:complete